MIDERILFYQEFPIFLNNGLYLQSVDNSRKEACYFYPKQHGCWGDWCFLIR